MIGNYNGRLVPAFPITRHSVVLSLASEEADIRRAAFDALAMAYWKPVFKYVRLKWSTAPDEAADLTQAFFLKAYEKAYFASFDPAKAKFRTDLRTCLDRFVGPARRRPDVLRDEARPGRAPRSLGGRVRSA